MNLQPSIAPASDRRPFARADRRAFTLVEILTVVALLGFIILGLMATFNQTQRAWRTTMTQTDVLAAGRMSTELIGREFLAAKASYLPRVVNFDVRHGLFGVMTQSFPNVTPPGSEVRLNYKQEVFFLTQENKAWRAIGYRVDSPDPAMIASGIGTLYRFEVTNAVPSLAMLDLFVTSSVAQPYFTPIIQGVVHFMVRTFDANGVPLSPAWFLQSGLTNSSITNIFVRTPPVLESWPCTFYSNALPAGVDVELGILEGRTADRAQAIPDGAVRTQYLEKQLGAVHVFRQRIPLRNLATEAYR